MGSVTHCRPDGVVHRTSPSGSCPAFQNNAERVPICRNTHCYASQRLMFPRRPGFAPMDVSIGPVRSSELGEAAARTAFSIGPREEPGMNDGDCPITSLADAAAWGASIRRTKSWIATPLVRVVHRGETHDCSRCGSRTERLAGPGAPAGAVACAQAHVPNAMKEYAVERATESVPTAFRASMRASARPDPARRWS